VAASKTGARQPPRCHSGGLLLTELKDEELLRLVALDLNKALKEM